MDQDRKPCCEAPDIHDDILSSIAGKMPDENMLIDLSDLFKMFSDHSRLKILYALYLSEMSVCDLSNSLEMSQSAVSHQLRLLRGAGLVKFRREGKSVFYSLDDEHVTQIIHMGMSHILHEQGEV